jgi:hypothetical protein
MEELGLTKSQVRRIVENILSNSPGFVLSDLFSKDVRIVATRGPSFRPFGIVHGYSSEAALVLVTNRELGFTEPATPAETCARAQALGLRDPTETEFALMQAHWDQSEEEVAVRVGTTLYSLYTCRSLEEGAKEDLNATETFGPEKQWVFVQS